MQAVVHHRAWAPRLGAPAPGHRTGGRRREAVPRHFALCFSRWSTCDSCIHDYARLSSTAKKGVTPKRRCFTYVKVALHFSPPRTSTAAPNRPTPACPSHERRSMPQTRREASYLMPNTRHHLTLQLTSEPKIFRDIPRIDRARCSSISSRSMITPFCDPLIRFTQPTGGCLSQGAV